VRHLKGWFRLWVVLSAVWWGVTLFWSWEHWPEPVNPVRASYVIGSGSRGGLTLQIGNTAAQEERRRQITWLLAMSIGPPLLAYAVAAAIARVRRA
jgi:hypothetical protein